MKVFISYRRQDSEWVTLSIYNALKQQLPQNSIFKDFNVIKPGEDFTKAIESNLQSCDVLLVVIGPDWLTCKNDAGVQRLFEPGDYVCFEIATALQKGKKVIPVLINNTIMPSAEALPEQIGELHKLQAVKIDGNNFEMDVFSLAHAIEEATGKQNQYTNLVNDIVTGKVGRQELEKPDSNTAYSIVCMALGLLLLIFNTDSVPIVIICIAMIAAGGYAYFLSRKVKTGWLNKDFEKARQYGKRTKLISIIAPVSGVLLLLVVILLQSIGFLASGGMEQVNDIVSKLESSNEQPKQEQPGQASGKAIPVQGKNITQTIQPDSYANQSNPNIYLISQNTSIFSGPDINELTDYYLYAGSVVELIETRYPFSLVNFTNTDGVLYSAWVATDDLQSYENQTNSETYYQVAQNTNIYLSPNVNDLSEFYLAAGTIVELLDEQYPFAQVNFLHSDGETYSGWVASDDLISVQ